MKKSKFALLFVTAILLLCVTTQSVIADTFRNNDYIGNGIQYFYYPDTKEMEIKRVSSNGEGSTLNYAVSPFVDCGVEKVTIGDGVIKIGYDLFKDCKTLKSAEIGSSVLYTTQAIFENCTSLTDVKLSDGLISLGPYIFENCTALKSLSIPDSVTEINNGIFYGCTSINDIKLSKNITKISGFMFKDCTSLTKIDIPDGVTTIDRWAFYGCSNLSGVFEMSDKITEIGEYIFYGCSSLTGIKLSKNLTSIPYGAFENCTALKEIEIPDDITSIGYEAFYGCKNLSGDFVVPQGVTEIKSRTFAGCSSLSNILLSNNIEKVAAYAFQNVNGNVYIDCLPGYRLMDDTSYSNTGNAKYLKDMCIAEVADVNYAGAAVEPEISVSIKNQMTGETVTQLAEGRDYTVEYFNNDKIGTATAAVTYIGDYTDYDGEVNSVDFEIMGKSADNLIISPIPNQIYTGKAITPTLDIRDLD